MIQLQVKSLSELKFKVGKTNGIKITGSSCLASHCCSVVLTF